LGEGDDLRVKKIADALWEEQVPIEDWSAHRQTDTHKSENSISVSFTPFTWHRYKSEEQQTLSACWMSRRP